MAVPSEQNVFVALYWILPWPSSLPVALNFVEIGAQGVLRHFGLNDAFVFFIIM